MKRMLRSAVFAATLLATQYASATGIPVFEVANFGQNVITAAKAVSGEIYQNTNVMYQYQMMANQLLQATKLDPSAMKAQFDQITGDISKIKNLNSTLKNLYGSLTDDGQWLSQVQTLITRSGKSNDQWFSDMNTLYQQNDKVAKNLFNMGTSIMADTDDLAKRRQDLQSQLSLSPTAQATAELTTHYLDIVTSQNADLLQLNAAKAQHDAQEQSQALQDRKERAAAGQKFIQQQDAERAAYGFGK
ncbi:type VI secretion protein [Burkholderia vietnamiensis]|uniref:type VI secretion protein n=1 Tax=Burkholderia vietnamiensis TaxID=60552 RepID=UPI001591C812|nr:type VI secretion protein [Burkholderia vietnamiensis]